MRICRKEDKEIVYWLQLIVEANPEFKDRVAPLLQETVELVKIFTAILEKTKNSILYFENLNLEFIRSLRF